MTNPALKFSAPESNNVQTLANELDVVVLRDNALYLIECKAGKKFPEQADNYTTKLDSLRDTLGGMKGKGLLISQYALNPSSEKRAHEYQSKPSLVVLHLNLNLCWQNEIDCQRMDNPMTTTNTPYSAYEFSKEINRLRKERKIRRSLPISKKCTKDLPKQQIHSGRNGLGHIHNLSN